MKNTYVRTLSNVSPLPAPQENKRKVHMDRIRSSLQKVPLIKSKLALNTKRMSQLTKDTPNRDDTNSGSSSSREDSENPNSVENFELFE